MTDTEILTMVLKNIQSMQSELRHMKDEIHDLQYTIQGIQNDIADLRSDMRNVKGDVYNLQKDFTDAQKDAENLREDVLKNAFTLETTINQCITLLGDGYRATIEKIDKLHIDSIIAENNVQKNELELVKTQLALVMDRLNIGSGEVKTAEIVEDEKSSDE